MRQVIYTVYFIGERLTDSLEMQTHSFYDFFFYNNTAHLYLPQLSCSPLLFVLFHLPVNKRKKFNFRHQYYKLLKGKHTLFNQLLMWEVCDS